tara:strand:- start:13047 stop:13445 length:399 start_codon:yes stop_codon:yes gene_type:complete
MAYASIKLPKVRKTQVIDHDMATPHMQAMVKLLDQCVYSDSTDYQCAVNELVDYMDNQPEGGSGYTDMCGVDAPIAAAINLNNCAFLFSDEERQEIAEAYLDENIKIEFSDEHGWLPVIDKGYKTFFVADTY